MRSQASCRRERGALQEIPIAVAIVLIAVAVLMDHVGITGKKLLVAVDGVALLALFYYFILAPGWRPGTALPASLRVRWILFGLLAVLVIGVVIGFAVVYTGP
jgi:hypothetical protein